MGKASPETEFRVPDRPLKNAAASFSFYSFKEQASSFDSHRFRDDVASVWSCRFKEDVASYCFHHFKNIAGKFLFPLFTGSKNYRKSVFDCESKQDREKKRKSYK
jgi:hypothetical protein